ncbi:MAG: HAD family phosphatase [Anaerolineales bacterium]
MTIRAVFFDLGGVLVRTEYQTPRQHLAERLGMEYEDLEKLVFGNPSSLQASIGKITTEQHWEAVAQRLRRPMAEAESLRQAFFAGDVIDHNLLAFIRALRPRLQTGIISNGWPDLREYIIQNRFNDAFDYIIISAEVGVMKPEARIYQIALEQAGVSPSEAIFIDDMPVNIQGCQAVGMRGIHFSNPQQALRELQALLAD